ncbi:MAG: BRO-N domain-containing protein, partial [Cetobacterium sp.]
SDYLGYIQASDMLRNIDFIEENTTKQNMLSDQGNYSEVRFIDEVGIYECVLKIRKTDITRYNKAREFQRWVFSEVLPSIRKNGFYLGESFDKDELEKQLRERDVIIDNFSNVLKFNKKRTQLLKTFITDMFPSNKDAYGQFVQSMIKAKMLTEDLQPTEVFDIQNKRKNMFVHNTRVGLNGINIELQLTNIGMEELAKRLYLEDGELKIKKVELGVVNKTNLTLF